MKMLRSILLMVIALILVIMLSPLAFIIGLILYRDNLPNYFYTIAVGLDQLGGSVLYNEEDWTVSSYTYYLCNCGNKYACYFMKVIDFIFGKEHCENSYFKEKIEFAKRIGGGKNAYSRI